MASTENKADLTLKRGVSKPITFTFTDEDTGVAVDMSGATFTMNIRPKAGSSKLTLQKLHAAFNIAQIANGVISVQLVAADTDLVGRFEMELKSDLSANDIGKSETFTIDFEEAIT